MRQGTQTELAYIAGICPKGQKTTFILKPKLSNLPVILLYIKENLTRKELGSMFGKSIATIQKTLKRYNIRKCGTVEEV